MRTHKEMMMWAKEAKQWKKRVLKARERYYAGKCTLEEYENGVDSSTLFGNKLLKALS